MHVSKDTLRRIAFAHSLFPQTSLVQAITRLGFVQADPIRSPARAQDLILRHRVKNYRKDDLEKYYPELGIEEDFLYAYGFIIRELQQYMYPRKLRPLTKLEKQILIVAKEVNQPLSQKELELQFGKRRVINAWGGYSQEIKVALDSLHYAGYLRISGRDKGRRIYAINRLTENSVSQEERLKKIVMAIVRLLSPVTERTLNESLTRTRQHIGHTKPIIDLLVKSGELQRHTVDNMTYLWLADVCNTYNFNELSEVKLLAPFDPLVWDRRRFEHLWGWPYRFEAYTPPHKRVRGYYALPLLWGENIIGWTNILNANGIVQFELGYINGEVRDTVYKDELEKEILRMKIFLGVISP